MSKITQRLNLAMQKYSGQQWCRDISESGPTVARQWTDSARQGPTPRQSGLKDTGPAVRHVRHPRHLRHARHSDTRHSDTLRHDPRVSPVQPPSDTDQTQARHLRHRRHQCQSTPLRHCFDTPRHYSDTSDTSDTQTHQGSSVWPMACVSAAHCGAVALVLYSDPRPTDPSAASGLGSSERSRASRPVSAGLGRSRPVSSGLERSRAVSRALLSPSGGALLPWRALAALSTRARQSHRCTCPCTSDHEGSKPRVGHAARPDGLPGGVGGR